MRAILFRQFRKHPLPANNGEKVPILTAETSVFGSFIGDAVSLPVFQAGTFLTILIFMFLQDWVFALAVIPQLLILVLAVPVMQQRYNANVRRRMLLTRHVALMISRSPERPDTMVKQFVYGPFQAMTANFKMVYRLGFLASVWGFLILFVINFITQLNFVAVMTVGGYLVLKGDITLGALVAVLAANKDMLAPAKELIRFYQRYSQTQVLYWQIKRRFDDPTGALFVPV
jgi:putative ABC transport system ATP-binding protein